MTSGSVDLEVVSVEVVSVEIGVGVREQPGVGVVVAEARRGLGHATALRGAGEADRGVVAVVGERLVALGGRLEVDEAAEAAPDPAQPVPEGADHAPHRHAGDEQDAEQDHATEDHGGTHRAGERDQRRADERTEESGGVLELGERRVERRRAGGEVEDPEPGDAEEGEPETHPPRRPRRVPLGHLTVLGRLHRGEGHLAARTPEEAQHRQPDRDEGHHVAGEAEDRRARRGQHRPDAAGRVAEEPEGGQDPDDEQDDRRRVGTVAAELAAGLTPAAVPVGRSPRVRRGLRRRLLGARASRLALALGGAAGVPGRARARRRTSGHSPTVTLPPLTTRVTPPFPFWRGSRRHTGAQPTPKGDLVWVRGRGRSRRRRGTPGR